MARFLAEIQGNRGEATRCGTADSGIGGHIRGWNCGVTVCGGVAQSDVDEFRIFATSGSNGRQRDRYIGTVSTSPNTGEVVFTPAGDGQ